MTPIWYGILGLAILVSLDAYASEDVQLTVTVTCDIHPDDLDGIISGIDTGMIDLGPYSQDCTISTRHTGTAEPSSVTVTIPDGALFPDCQITNDCFDPYTVTIPEGTTVSWVNNDAVPHTVTGIEPHPDGTLNSLVSAGGEFAYTFDTPGTYWYACSVHPWAKGVVIVESGDVDTTPMELEVQPRDSVALQQVAELITQYREDGAESFQDITGLRPFQEVAGLIVSLYDQTIVAHNSNPLFVGLHYGHLVGSASIPSDVILDVAQTQGVWISYPVSNDMGDITVYERGWVRIYDNHAFISGYPVTIQESVQGIVSEMVRLYALGEMTFDMIDSFHMSSQTYPFVLDMDGLVVASGHGGMLDMLDVIPPLEEGHGVWIEYVPINPDTDEEYLKRSWLVMHDGYVFGSGYYP